MPLWSKSSCSVVNKTIGAHNATIDGESDDRIHCNPAATTRDRMALNAPFLVVDQRPPIMGALCTGGHLVVRDGGHGEAFHYNAQAGPLND